MSWAEVFKINSNIKKPLNEQIRGTVCLPMRLITSSTTYKPEKTGWYKVICVGAGGSCGSYSGVSNASGQKIATGGGGGVAIKTIKLSSAQSYSVTVSTTASFGSILSATAGGSGSASSSSMSYGTGGTASGGDYNFTGCSGTGGSGSSKTGVCFAAGGTGVAITELSRTVKSGVIKGDEYVEVTYGESILGYGSGAPGFVYTTGTSYYCYTATAQSAVVIIIPLEMEE